MKCRVCGAEVPPRKTKHGKRNGPITRYCSGACRAKASRQRHSKTTI